MFKNSNFKFQIGFTLIELLVVLAIIGTISAVLYGTLGPNIKSGRNAERKSDIAKYKLALEGFATNNDTYYPMANATSRLSQFCSNYLSTFIPDCPEDSLFPTDSSYYYMYQAYGASLAADGNPTATRWVLWAKLETTSKYWVSCSNGKSGELPQAGFIVTGGDCPIP